MRTAADLIKLEIAQRESYREILQEGHPAIMQLNESIEELRQSLNKLEDETDSAAELPEGESLS